MIKILKLGIKPKNTKTIYKTICGYCGCMFEFEAEDLKAQERHIDGSIFIDCPNCRKELQRTYNELDQRIVEVKGNE